MERGFFSPIVQNESPRILTKERGIWTNWVLSAWLFIKGYRWVKNDGNEMLKLYRVIYPESWSLLWLLTEWLIVIKWARYESNGYGGKITKHRTKPLHIRHLLPWEFKCRKIVRPYKASDYSTSVCLSEFDEVLVKHKTRQTYNAGTHGNQSMLELIIAYW